MSFRRSVRLCSGVILASAVVAIATTASAQAPAHAHANSASAAPDAGARDQNPGAFHEAARMPTTNIGTGSASANATGPVGELRGDTEPAPGAITGPIGPSDVARIMQVQMPRLRPCYDNARATHPHLAGRVEVRFTIGRDGHVTAASATGLPEAPDVATCVATTLRQTTFPQPEGGSLQFIYPLMFQPPLVIPTHGHGAHPAPAHPAHPATH